MRGYFLSSLRVRFMSRELCTHGLVCLPDLCTGSWQLRVRRVRNGLAAAAYLREALDELRLMSRECMHGDGALRAC